MKRVLVCLGILFVLIMSSYAKDSASETPSRDSQTSATNTNSSTRNSQATKTHTQDHTSPAASSKEDDREPSGRRTNIRLSGISASAGYAHFSPVFYPYGFPYGPYYYPFSAASGLDPLGDYAPPLYPGGYFGPANGKGELRLNEAPKDASVFVNGGYAGTVDHLKSFWLDPGAYDLVLSAPDGRRYEQRVYVLTGKTLRIEAKMKKPTEGEKP